MTGLKTKPRKENVKAFLDRISDERKREDAYTILDLMKAATKAEPVMWGGSIVGFGNYHYVYESGREGDWFLVGFLPRKDSLTLYLMGGINEHTQLLKELGTFKAKNSCLYIKSLAGIHLPTLKKLIKSSVASTSMKHSR